MPTTAVTNDRQDAPDPLGKLHHMSTTAGVGAYDYVAVNTAAVWAILLGLGSALALVDPYLLLVPMVAIVFSVVALRQISDSNGTQTGRWLAWLGMAFAVFFASYVGALLASEARQNEKDRQAVVTLSSELSDSIKAGDFQKAYGLFSEEFQQRVPFDRFQGQMKFVQNAGSVYGALERLESNGYVRFEGTFRDEIRYGQSQLKLHFDKSKEAISQDAVFRRRGGEWRIENIPSLFAPQK